METAGLIIAYIPLVGWMIWLGIKPFMLCRDVESGITTRDALIHLLIEAVLCFSVLLLIPRHMWRGVNLGVFGAMFLIGLAGMIRTVIAFIRIKKASNHRLEATGDPLRGPPAPQP